MNHDSPNIMSEMQNFVISTTRIKLRAGWGEEGVNAGEGDKDVKKETQ